MSKEHIIREEKEVEIPIKLKTFYQMDEAKQINRQFIPDAHLLQIYENYQKICQFPVGLDQVLLKYQDEDFLNNFNFSANDIHKLNQDRKEYHKYLCKNSKLFLPKDFFKKKQSQISKQDGEDKIIKKTKLDDLFDDEKGEENSDSSDQFWDSEYGEREFEASDDNYSVERDDYD